MIWPFMALVDYRSNSGFNPIRQSNQAQIFLAKPSADNSAGQAHAVQEGTDHRHADLAGTVLTRADLGGIDLDHIEPGHDLAGCIY